MAQTGTQSQRSESTFGTEGSGGQQMSREHTEGTIARTIEEQTAKLPSDLFLWAAVGAIGTSLILELSGKEEKAHFLGQWVAPFLLLGVYNKLVKIGGSDRLHK